MRFTLSLPRLLPVIAIAVVTFTHDAEARKIKTKHSVAKLSARQLEEERNSRLPVISISTDSATFVNRIQPYIRFYGFDKTVTSGLESFFILNGLDSTIYGMEIRITYTDMKGRQLHRRDVKIECEIPPHETIRTDIKSWDAQKSFYFHRSAKPRRQATPFDIHIELLSANL